tara:strand:- start:1033 stop:1239 length:207 start_codon:yes stop_codon:yes gene_type:complete
MAKFENKNSAKINQIFDDLEKYLTFCVDHGYPFNQAELYNSKSYIFRQFTKFDQGIPVRNNWDSAART